MLRMQHLQKMTCGGVGTSTAACGACRRGAAGRCPSPCTAGWATSEASTAGRGRCVWCAAEPSSESIGRTRTDERPPPALAAVPQSIEHAFSTPMALAPPPPPLLLQPSQARATPTPNHTPVPVPAAAAASPLLRPSSCFPHSALCTSRDRFSLANACRRRVATLACSCTPTTTVRAGGVVVVVDLGRRTRAEEVTLEAETSLQDASLL